MEWLRSVAKQLKGPSDSFVGSKLDLAGQVVTVKEVIGKGGFGVVCRCESPSGDQLALKRMFKLSKDRVSLIRRETRLWVRLDSEKLSISSVSFPCSPRFLSIFKLLDHIDDGTGQEVR
eukprot:m.174512 g.174512  ORF g.174512 m.174512 type:complete len:119 (-) comp14592_c0_seq4:1105-1461(-)